MIHGTQIRLQHVSTGGFLMAENGGNLGYILLSDTNRDLDDLGQMPLEERWKIFKIWRPTTGADGLTVGTYLRVYDNHVIQASNGGGGMLHSHGNHHAPHEYFTIISKPGTNPNSFEQQVHIRVANGQYLQVENGALRASFEGEPEWVINSTLFKMIIVANRLEDVVI